MNLEIWNDQTLTWTTTTSTIGYDASAAFWAIFANIAVRIVFGDFIAALTIREYPFCSYASLTLIQAYVVCSKFPAIAIRISRSLFAIGWTRFAFEGSFIEFRKFFVTNAVWPIASAVFWAHTETIIQIDAIIEICRRAFTVRVIAGAVWWTFSVLAAYCNTLIIGIIPIKITLWCYRMQNDQSNYYCHKWILK